MEKDKNKLALAAGSMGPKIPKRIQERLMDKMLDMNDEKIIEKIQQRNSHKEAIARIDKEIEAMCSLNME